MSRHHNAAIDNANVARKSMPHTAALAVAYQAEHLIRCEDFQNDKLAEDECIDPLHIVMEDGNIEDYWFSGPHSLLDKYPIEWKALPCARQLAEHLAELPEAQRQAVSEHYWLWHALDNLDQAPAWVRNAARTPLCPHCIAGPGEAHMIGCPEVKPEN